MNITEGKNAMDIENPDEDDRSKAVMLFGRDIRKVPCFKHSMLSGIYGGLATGLATFMFTSRVKLSLNMAMTSYMGVVVVCWCFCRYNHVKQKYAMNDVRIILQKTSGDDAEGVNEAFQEQPRELVDA